MEVGVLRPYHGVSAGSSVGTYSEFLHDEIEGTLGMAFLDEVGNPVLLSSNHVFCGIDTVQHPTARMGQPIWENTPYGKHNIATLENWVPIDEEGGNIAEPASARPLSTTTINPDVIGLGIPEAIADPVPQLPVMKMGRGTVLTISKVIDVHASVKVDFEGAFSTTFDDQMLIADGPRFSRTNDSGASILAKVDNKLLAVGLLMGGSEQVTMANKMTNVARLLGFNLPTATIV